MTFKDLRKNKYRTAADLAEKLCIPSARIAKWEQGTAAPKIRDLRAVAKALGVSLNTLVEALEETAG